MADEGFKRKLTAIFSADVEGYSRLMGDDEEATVRTLKSYREVLTTLIQQHNGIVLDSPGDNLLAEFVSVVDAVQCAVAVQKEIHARNEELPENRRMQFRIGINLGDVIQEEGRIYGDGVNIAARLESLAEPGGICISKTAFDHIESKLPYGYDFIGEQMVKNIAKPVGTYRVLLDPRVTVSGKPARSTKSKQMTVFAGAAVVLVLAIAVGIWQYYEPRPTEEPASLEKKVFPLPEKPFIAVLPFDNMSKDPEQEYFVDGMTDDLITDLSKISGLFVIARNSTFQYKGKAVDVKEVSRNLGIRYVLEGSVRKAGDQVRINAQLIDTRTGGHLWAERYDGQMVDIFSLQDKITMKIVAALAVKLTPDEKENIASKGTSDIEAYDAFMKGWQHYLRWTPKDAAAAIQYFKEAIELDPKYYNAYAAMALIYDYGAGSGKEWTKALQADYFTSRAKARQFLDVAMKKPTTLAYRVASQMDLRRRRYNEALREIEKAIAISPNNAEVQLAMTRALIYTGRPKDALDLINKVMLLDPNRMADCLFLSGIAHFCLEQYEESISSFERASKYNPHLWLEQWFAINYAHLGRQKDAEIAFKSYEKRWLGAVAGASIGAVVKVDIQPQVYNNPFKDPEVTKRFVDGLIKAGHPEPHRYYEVSKNNKLTGEEIRALVFGRTTISPMFAGGSWTIKNGKDGSAIYEGYGMKDRGKNWIEGDQLCNQYKIYLSGLKVCQEIYRNPKGSLEGRDEYLLINDLGMLPVSYID